MFRPLRTLAKSLARPIDRFVLRALQPRICAVTGLTPMTELNEDDIFIVGYPKSGNTWFQNLVTGVIFGMDPQYASDFLIQTLVPDVAYRPYYRRFSTPMFFKSHHLPTPEYKRVVYLLRDGRDVMVSYLHHIVALSGKEIDFLQMVQRGENLGVKWHQHVEAWLSNPYNAAMMVIKYEDLKRGTVKELQRFCEFVGIQREQSFLERVVLSASFEKMREKEIRYGWDHLQWPKDKPFVRRGEVGAYKDEMPESVLEVFLNDAGETLHKCGYLGKCDSAGQLGTQ